MEIDYKNREIEKLLKLNHLNDKEKQSIMNLAIFFI